MSLFTKLASNSFWFSLAHLGVQGSLGASWAILTAETVRMVLFLPVWASSLLRQTDSLLFEGVSYELSDLS